MKHVIVLIDISYSMKKNSESIIKGLNKFVEKFKRSVEVYLSVMLFCDSRHYLCRAVPINTVEPFSTKQLPPFGTTFLYDAIGAILTEWGNEKGAEHHFFIITDGCDTGSVIFTKNGVANLCDDAIKSGWLITHCGVDSSNLGTGVLEIIGEIDDLEGLLGSLSI